jgi:hypothetical protein
MAVEEHKTLLTFLTIVGGYYHSQKGKSRSQRLQRVCIAVPYDGMIKFFSDE